MEVIGVRFSFSNRIIYYSFEGLECSKGSSVVCATEYGNQLGSVVTNAIDIDPSKINYPINSISRIANENDIKNNEKNISDALLALEKSKKLAIKHKLDMHIINALYTLERDQLLFFFVADSRVDFRELARELAAIYKTRIELRQIGPRDKAGIVGGLGVCGLKLCCSSFLDTFDGISISMAKNQMLSLNIQKLSGHCGKLMCCLKYEDQAYSELKTKYPPIGSRVIYNNKQYTITGLNVISGNLTISDGEGLTIVSSKEVKVIGSGKDKDVKKK